MCSTTPRPGRRSIVVATPSGDVAPEGAPTSRLPMPLIGMAQDGSASLSGPMRPALGDQDRHFDDIQRSGTKDDEEGWSRDGKGGSVYLRADVADRAGQSAARRGAASR